MDLTERVLAVERRLIDPLCSSRFSTNTDAVRKIALANACYLERRSAESDLRYKQIIPYVVISHQNRVLLMRRTTGQTEARLHNQYSIGVGGHINDTDNKSEYADIIDAGMRRELNEEIAVPTEESCRLIGVINDDSTEVAKVHMGFVYVMRLRTPEFTIMEPDKYTAEWMYPSDTTQYYDSMESWTKLIHDTVLFSEIPNISGSNSV